MATKPRAAKAPIPAPATKRAAASSAKSPAKSAPAKSAPAKTAGAKSPPKTAAKPAAKAVGKPAVKAVVKPAAKAAVKAQPAATAPARPAAKPAARRAAPAVSTALKRAAKAAAGAAQPAAGNPSLVRDSFTMPEAEYAVFASAKQRCLQAGVDIKKSELLRIGMALVGQLDVATLQAVLASLPQLKTGRPRSEQAAL